MSGEITIAGIDEHSPTSSTKINGPPGTGKTTQGLARVRELIENYDYDVSDLAWVTYRRSLAEDVLDRLADWNIAYRGELEKPWEGRTRHISTAHAVARRIATEGPVKQYDTPEWSDYQDFMLSRYNLPYQSSSRTKPDYGQLAVNVYYWLENNLEPMSSATEAPGFDTLNNEWLSHPQLDEFAAEWEEYKDENQLVDYHEYLEHALEERLIPPCDIVVIDEYHDVYPLMDEVCQMWAEEAEVSLILGDPQQVINIHEGSDPSLFSDIDLPEIQLDKTWRVPPAHWNAATDVLSGWHDPHHPDFDGGGGEIHEIRPPQIDYNDTTETWMSPTGRYGTPDDLAERFEGSMMYLARTQRMVQGISAALDEAGVIYRSQKGGWRSDDRRRHLYNALQRVRGLDVVMPKWEQYVTRWSDDAEKLGRDTTGDPQSKMHSYEAAYLLRHTPARLLDEERKKSDTKVSSILNSQPRVVDITDFTGFVTDEWWEKMTVGPSSAQILVNRQGESALDTDPIRRALDRNDEPTTSLPSPDASMEENLEKLHDDGLDDAPKVLTIHASKGAEADTVVVYDGITRSIQESVRRNTSQQANEDRVWYVALTRSNETLIVARDVFWWAEPYLPHTLSNGNQTPLPDQ